MNENKTKKQRLIYFGAIIILLFIVANRINQSRINAKIEEELAIERKKSIDNARKDSVTNAFKIQRRKDDSLNAIREMRLNEENDIKESKKLIQEYLEKQLEFNDDLETISVFYTSEYDKSKTFRGYKFFINDVNIKYYDDGSLCFICSDGSNCINEKTETGWNKIYDSLSDKCCFYNRNKTSSNKVKEQFLRYKTLLRNKKKRRAEG